MSCKQRDFDKKDCNKLTFAVVLFTQNYWFFFFFLFSTAYVSGEFVMLLFEFLSICGILWLPTDFKNYSRSVGTWNSPDWNSYILASCFLNSVNSYRMLWSKLIETSKKLLHWWHFRPSVYILSYMYGRRPICTWRMVPAFCCMIDSLKYICLLFCFQHQGLLQLAAASHISILLTSFKYLKFRLSCSAIRSLYAWIALLLELDSDIIFKVQNVEHYFAYPNENFYSFVFN